VAIPKEVYEEVVTRGSDLFGAKEVSSSKWIKIFEPDNRLAVDSLSMHLGKGEAEAIVLAKEKNTLLIIDDKDGIGFQAQQERIQKNNWWELTSYNSPDHSTLPSFAGSG